MSLGYYCSDVKGSKYSRSMFLAALILFACPYRAVRAADVGHFFRNNEIYEGGH